MTLTRTEQLSAALARTPSAAPRKRRPLTTTEPSGQVSWPTVLVEGGEGVGKSHMLAQFTRDPRVGEAYWFEIGEVSAHEFGGPGGIGKYKIVNLDGSWDDLIDQVYNVAEIAEKAHADGKPPVVAIFDTVSPVWDNCYGWAYLRAARERRNNKDGVATDMWDVNVGPLGWMNAKERWYQFLRPLRLAPMIVILAAKAAETVAIDNNGKPASGRTEYKIRAQRELPYDVNAIVRLSTDQPPLITKCRSPKWNLRPGVDPARHVRDLSLGRLVFDGMGFDPTRTQTPVHTDLAITAADAALPADVAARTAAPAAETTPVDSAAANAALAVGVIDLTLAVGGALMPSDTELWAGSDAVAVAQ